MRPKMASVSFPLQLDPAVKRRLEEEASNSDRSAAELAATAIEVFLQAQAARRAEIEAAVREAEAGSFVSAEAVDRWMDSRAEGDAERPH